LESGDFSAFLVSTVVSAQYEDEHGDGELFQPLIWCCRMPLKRLSVSGSSIHRAKATVVMSGDPAMNENRHFIE